MNIIIYLFTLLMALFIYKSINKYEKHNRSRNNWKLLIYWGTIVFISIIFNVMLYITNPSSYSLSFYSTKENLELIIFVIFSFGLIHLISPSGFTCKISLIFKKVFPFLGTKANSNMTNTATESKIDTELSEEVLPLPSKGIIKKTNSKYTQEKEFELFLNTLCWLAFSFALLLQFLIFFVHILQSKNIYLVVSDHFTKNFASIVSELSDIASLLLLVTLPIGVRQIFFYLNKLKNGEYSSVSNKSNSIKEENHKYFKVQNRLSETNKKL